MKTCARSHKNCLVGEDGFLPEWKLYKVANPNERVLQPEEMAQKRELAQASTLAGMKRLLDAKTRQQEIGELAVKILDLMDRCEETGVQGDQVLHNQFKSQICQLKNKKKELEKSRGVFAPNPLKTTTTNKRKNKEEDKL